MVNSMCQLEKAIDFWANINLGVSVRIFLDEINI